MSEAISIPAGAFEAAKSGVQLPTTPKGEAPPKTVTRKAEAAPKPEEKAPDVTKEVEKVETPAEIQRKIWKLKDGDQEYEYDATDEERVKRDLMKIRAADKRFEEGAMTKRQAETFFQMLKDPAKLESVLSDPRIGVDVKKWAEELVWKQIEEDKLTPQEKAQRDRDREYERLKSQEDNEKLTKAEQEKQQRQAGYESEYEKSFLKALESKGVPKDQETVMAMADFAIACVKKGYNPSAEDMADFIKQRNGNYLKLHTEHMTDEQFVEFIGEQGAARVRNSDLKKLRSPTGNPFPERYPKPDKKTDKPQKFESSSDWRKSAIDDFMKMRRGG